MFMGIWSAAIGLVFGWCVMLLTAEKDWPLWARAGASAVVSSIAAFLFDYLAFEGANSVFALIGGAIGGAAAALAYHGLAARLERRPRSKPGVQPYQGQ